MDSVVLPTFSFSLEEKASELLHQLKNFVAIWLSRAEQPALLAKFLQKEHWVFVDAVAESKLQCQEAVCLVSSSL